MGQPVKVRFTLESSGFSSESLWAERIGHDLFRLMNVPFQTMGYAEGDVVICVERDGWNEVTGMVHDSGNGTLLLLFEDSESSAAQEVLAELMSVGCTYERGSPQLVGITVPPHSMCRFHSYPTT